MADIIENTPIINSHDEDFLCWKLTPSGKCNSKSAYRACLQILHEQGEPKPRQVNQDTKMLLRQIWKNKQMTPRVQTFGWRLLQKAMPTGARAGKYTIHIPKTCCKCGFEENDKHLFFTCNFARASWFSEPWYIRTDFLAENT
jgi:predicted Zn-ribbon and HTH transcriptional regulator